MKKIKIFIDSNVLIAGLASDQGASSKLLKLIEEKKVDAYLNRIVFAETEKNIKKKLPESLSYFYAAIKILPLKNLLTPKNLDKRLNRFFFKRADQVIFETANRLKPDFFITLNRKHFHTRKIRKIAHFKIRTPAQFLDEWENF